MRILYVLDAIALVSQSSKLLDHEIIQNFGFSFLLQVSQILNHSRLELYTLRSPYWILDVWSKARGHNAKNLSRGCYQHDLMTSELLDFEHHESLLFIPSVRVRKCSRYITSFQICM